MNARYCPISATQDASAHAPRSSGRGKTSKRPRTGPAGKLLKSEELHQRISSTVARLDTMLERLNDGQGTLGQVLVNPQLYESLNGAAAETREFMKAFRANPKKFLRIKLGLF